MSNNEINEINETSTKENDSTKEKKQKVSFFERIKNFKFSQLRVSFADGIKKLDSSGKVLGLTVAGAVVFMVLVCLAVFFMTVRGPEKVLVPDVEGRELTQALMEMQVKELYPKIQKRYDEKAAGTILSQSPSAGSILKAGTTVTLTVSRGAIVTEVGNYIGETFDKVKLDLSTMFTGSSRHLIVLADPVYKADMAEAGTILEQDPPAGTKISEPVTVNLVVSRGPNFDNTKVPYFVGKSVKDMLSLLSNSKVVVDFTGRKAQNGEKEWAVISQDQSSGEFVPVYSRVNVEITFPAKPEEDSIYGIFEANLADYPYPVEMSLECIEKTGRRYEIIKLNHTGGHFTVPYLVSEGSELILKIAGKEVKRQFINR